MGKSSRVQHEGIVKSISTQTLEVSIISHSACSGCHAKSACGIADMKEKSYHGSTSQGRASSGRQSNRIRIGK